MTSFPSIEAFLAHLATLPAKLHQSEAAGMAAAGARLVERAKDMIGRETNDWPALTAETVARKQAMGWTGRVSATDPLLASGELRASISSVIAEATPVDDRGVVLGSNDPIAPYQENGTGRIPPRPFISATMFEHGHKAADMVAEHVNAAMAGARAPADRKP